MGAIAGFAGLEASFPIVGATVLALAAGAALFAHKVGVAEGA